MTSCQNGGALVTYQQEAMDGNLNVRCAGSAGALAARMRILTRLTPLCNSANNTDIAGVKRLLGPLATLRLFLLQVLHGNTLAITHACDISSGICFAAASYCDARARLPLAALQGLLQSTLLMRRDCPQSLQSTGGRGLPFVDGSSFSMPDTKHALHWFSGLQAQPEAGRGLSGGEESWGCWTRPVAGLFVKVSAASRCSRTTCVA